VAYHRTGHPAAVAKFSPGAGERDTLVTAMISTEEFTVRSNPTFDQVRLAGILNVAVFRTEAALD
jgi:hypothetical protein